MAGSSYNQVWAELNAADQGMAPASGGHHHHHHHHHKHHHHHHRHHHLHHHKAGHHKAPRVWLRLYQGHSGRRAGR